MDRRGFLKNSLVLGGSGWAYSMTPQLFFSLEAAAQDTNAPTLVLIFLRGAMDGISMTPPVDDPDYKTARPNIAIGKNNTSYFKMNDGFGVHPALGNVHKIVTSGEGLFMFGAGSPADTRSHFDAQDWMETGTTNSANMQSGFLGRLATTSMQQNSMRPGSIIAVQNSLPRILRGCPGAMAFPTLRSLQGKNALTRDKFADTKNAPEADALDPAFYRLYALSKDPLFHNAAVSLLSDLPYFTRADDDLKSYEANMPKGPLAKSLSQIAALIRTRAGVRLAVTEMGGWDTHVNQGDGEKGSLHDRFVELDEALAFFWAALDRLRDNVCVVAVTEFGRTVVENGDRGTDHGHGSSFLVLGTRVSRRGVLHNHKGLRKDLLYEGRDLPVVFDYRDILNEVIEQHLKLRPQPGTIFPGYTPKRVGIYS